MDIKGHTVHRVLVDPGARHRGGVLRLLPARPGQPHVPGDGLGYEGGMEIEQLAVERPEALAKVPVDALDRRRRGQGRARSLTAAKFPAEVIDDRSPTSWSSCGRPSSAAGRHAGRGQPAGPKVRDGDGSVARARRQGHPGRQRRLPARRATPSSPTPPPADPLEAEGQGEGPQLRQARRRGRHHRQRRRPGDVDPRRRRLRRRGGTAGVTPGQLPRHRRRRLGRGDGQRAGHHPDRPVRHESVFVNVFGGITSCDAVANGIVAALRHARRRGRASRWSCGSTATTSRRAGGS